jgi:hypothetical protein
MHSLPPDRAPVNPPSDDWPDDIVDQVDDPAEDLELWAGYEQWRRDCALEDVVPVLLAWARETLPAPVLPCRCLDKTCLRCRVAAIVGKP